MALEKVQRVTGRGVCVPGDDVDTDRIIPARFMKCVTFDGLGQYLFYDARFDEARQPKRHPLNDARFTGATVLIAGSNFGCGSSREHAPQALAKYGFKAIVAESFAEIFFGNATTLGMPCVSLTRAQLEALSRHIDADPSAEITVDLEAQVVSAGDSRHPLTVKPGAREALLGGQWDPIGLLLEDMDRIREVAGRLEYLHL